MANNMTGWRSTAPANLMLMGEHSVVYGHPAVACSINQRITIDWQRRSDHQIVIESALANHQTTLENLTNHPQLNWVMASLMHFQTRLSFGLHIQIRSEFESTLGLGSSAAVLAAMLGGLNRICQTRYDTQTLFKIGHQIILDIQKRGSGTDLAASLHGGIILFTPEATQKLEHPLPLKLIYSGYKTPTATVLAKVANDWQNESELLHALYTLMGTTTRKAYQALQANETHDFYRLVNVYQGLMDALGVNDATLSHLIYECRQAGFAASKISGSGLGDCILAFGEQPLPASLDAFRQIPVEIDPLGMTVESFLPSNKE